MQPAGSVHYAGLTAFSTTTTRGGHAMPSTRITTHIRRTGDVTRRRLVRGLALLLVVLGTGLAVEAHPWSTQVAAAPAQQSGGLPSAVYLPLSLAQQAATAAMAACTSQGYHVAVTLVDRDGIVILSARGDGATGVTI